MVIIMNDKELKKLSRKELLEILLEQTRRIEDLETELEKTKNELNNRKVALKNVGTLAEASLVLSDIFKVADEAASIYIENIKELQKKEEEILEKQTKELNKKKSSDKKLKNNKVKDISKKRNKKTAKIVSKTNIKKEKVNE